MNDEIAVTADGETVPMFVARERRAAACDELMRWSFAIERAEAEAGATLARKVEDRLDVGID